MIREGSHVWVRVMLGYLNLPMLLRNTIFISRFEDYYIKQFVHQRLMEE